MIQTKIPIVFGQRDERLGIVKIEVRLEDDTQLDRNKYLVIDWDLNNTGTVNMLNMFNGASVVFNQPIGNWDVRAVTNFTNFMANASPAKYSSSNMDAIYNGWSTRPVVSGLTITFGTAKYTAAASAGRAILIGAPNNWVITDGGI